MFRHQGKNRTLKHNLQIASLLSFVAGVVNVTGFLAIQRLTTNVTGHFAFFIDDIANFQFWRGTIYLLYIIAFLAGSFASGLLIELVAKTKKFNIFVLPSLLEAIVLLTVVVISQFSFVNSIDVIACLLLFAMGVQNSFVTNISNAVVRTTHLTGLFTDLGIELSQLFFPNKYTFRKKILSTIKLRLYIISFFFMGGLIGGYIYSKIAIYTLIFAVLVLFSGLIYDNLKFKMLLMRRKYLQKNNTV
ncbi:MAG: YoaK family protein [Vicingaceae bacterium]|nr:YoaK family protein [Vicingaceae bacterium]